MEGEEKIAVLDPWQVWDINRTCFFVKIEATRQRHLGLVVHKDAFGRRFVIRGVR